MDMGEDQSVAWEYRHSVCGEGNQGGGDDEVQEYTENKDGLCKL